MPRPKRTNVQPSLPVSRRAAAPTSAAPVAAKQTNPAKQASSKADEENSDDSDGLVTTYMGKKKQKKPTEGNDFTMMSGGLGLGDTRNAHIRNAPKKSTGPNLQRTENPDHVKAMEGLKRRRDAALKTKVGPASGTIELKMTRERAASNLQDKTNSAKRSIFNAQDKASKAKETPVVNASVLLSNFKRRPRQPSILRHTAESEQDDTDLGSIGPGRSREPSVDSMQHRGTRSKPSLGLDSSILRLGNFKRRPRQASILQRLVNSKKNDDDEKEDDGFNPEDESTPLNLSKHQSRSQHDSNSLSPLSLPSSNPRKRKLASPRIQVPHSSPAAYIQHSGSESPLPSDHGEGHETDRQHSRIEQDITHHDWSITMAPPRSSSPSTQGLDLIPDSQPTQKQQAVAHPQKNPQRQQLARKRLATHTAEDKTSNMSGLESDRDEVAAVTVPSCATQKTKVQKKAPAISTAALQNMLPRRRRRAPRGDFDILSSSDAETNATQLGPEVDELSLSILPSKKSRRKTQATAGKNRVQKGKTPAKKTPAIKRTVFATPANKLTRTYGRQSSDKENAEASSSAAGEGDSLGPINSDEATPDQQIVKKGKRELKKLAKKFQDVDQWEMEFEEITASNSSPIGAR